MLKTKQNKSKRNSKSKPQTTTNINKFGLRWFHYSDKLSSPCHTHRQRLTKLGDGSNLIRCGLFSKYETFPSENVAQNLPAARRSALSPRPSADRPAAPPGRPCPAAQGRSGPSGQGAPGPSRRPGPFRRYPATAAPLAGPCPPPRLSPPLPPPGPPPPGRGRTSLPLPPLLTPLPAAPRGRAGVRHFY